MCTDKINKYYLFLYYNREKLGIPEEESIFTKNIAEYKEKSRKMEGFILQNKNLVEENLELKSDVREIIYKKINLRAVQNISFILNIQRFEILNLFINFITNFYTL